MILGIGVDLVQNDRFNEWVNYPATSLQKIFNNPELVFCYTVDGILIAEKLAVRFAAKEAFYKALSATLVRLKFNKKQFSLISLCSSISIINNEWGVPTLVVDWANLSLLYDGPILNVQVHLSLSHEKKMATAFVIIEGT